MIGVGILGRPHGGHAQHLAEALDGGIVARFGTLRQRVAHRRRLQAQGIHHQHNDENDDDREDREDHCHASSFSPTAQRRRHGLRVLPDAVHAAREARYTDSCVLSSSISHLREVGGGIARTLRSSSARSRPRLTAAPFGAANDGARDRSLKRAIFVQPQRGSRGCGLLSQGREFLSKEGAVLLLLARPKAEQDLLQCNTGCHALSTYRIQAFARTGIEAHLVEES